MRGKPIRRAWIAFLIGGSYRTPVSGGFAYGWRPSLLRMVTRYYSERWWRAGYTLYGWLVGSKGRGRGGLKY